jgi:hypothetical protein
MQPEPQDENQAAAQAHVESIIRKEKLYNQTVSLEKQCVLCKVVAGALFTGYGLFHGSRMQAVWGAYAMRENAFNTGMLLFVGLIAGANYYAAYQITMGRAFGLVEMRPSYSETIGNFYRFQTADDQ